MVNSDTDLADTRLLQAVHKMFRLATTRLIDATATLDPPALQRAIVPYWSFYAAILDYHHHTEDKEEFPVLVGLYPDVQPLIEQLGRDHNEMEGAIAKIDTAVKAFQANPDEAGRQRINAAATELRDFFFPHLDREDADVIPMFAKWIPPKEWERMDAKALRGIPKPQLPYAVGAIDEVIQSLPEAERPSGPPLPVKVMLSLSWRKKWAALSQPMLA
jgi:hemerythrin-like domain-containing protein